MMKENCSGGEEDWKRRKGMREPEDSVEEDNRGRREQEEEEQKPRLQQHGERVH